MSEPSFHRIKWIIKAGALEKAQIEAWTGIKKRDIHNIEIEAGNGFHTNW